MKIYITGLPSGYEVEHLVRLFYPMAPLTLTPPEEGEDCVWAEKKEDSLYAMVREQGQSRDAAAPLPRPVEAGGETVEFTLASLTYDLLRSWTGIRPPWGKMTGVRPVRLIHDKRAAGWTKAERTACISASRSAPPGAATAALSAATLTGTASWCSPMWTACAERWRPSGSRPTRQD